MRPDETALAFGRAPSWLREAIRTNASAFSLPAAHVEGIARELADEAARERFGETPAAVLAEEIVRRRREADAAIMDRLAPPPPVANVTAIHGRERR